MAPATRAGGRTASITDGVVRLLQMADDTRPVEGRQDEAGLKDIDIHSGGSSPIVEESEGDASKPIEDNAAKQRINTAWAQDVDPLMQIVNSPDSSEYCDEDLLSPSESSSSKQDSMMDMANI